MNSLPISYRYIPKSLSSRDFLKPLKTYKNSNKKLNEFMKTSNIKQLNTNGTSPIIIYKKTPKIHHRSDIELGILKTSDYVTDGGLKKKIEKFNSENNKNSKNVCISNSKSMIKKNCSQSMKIMTKKKENKNSLNNNLKINNKHIKRNNYFSPPPKSSSSKNKKKQIKKVKENNTIKEKKKEIKNETKKENESEIDEEKRKYMNQLIENAVAGYIRNIQLEKKPKIEEEMNEKKQKVLEDYGIEINIDSLENTQDEERKENENEYNDFEGDKIEEEINLNSQSSNYNNVKSNRNFTPQVNNYFITNQDTEKKIYKPKIDQFEFIRKINNERKKNQSRKSSISKLNNSNRKKEKLKDNSFRNSLSNEKINKDIYNNTNINSKNDNETYDSSLLFSYNRNLRTEEELKNYNKMKKEKLRKQTEEEELEKNKKLFSIFKNLFSLSTKEQIESNAKSNRISKRKRIKNEYYVGNDSISNSTIIEANDYYMNILESQQLLVNGGLYKIDIDELNNNQYDNYEQMEKITEKESSRKDTEEENNSNKNTLNQLKERVNQSITKNQNLINKYTESNNNSKNDNIKLQINSNNNITENINTKDNIIPSLSHTYTGNSNQNQKLIIEIEPRTVLNLIEIIKLIIKRKIFYNLLEIYINTIISQRYTVGISYLIAIIKQYPFRKIEEFVNYRTYFLLAFYQLFKPFLKKMFYYFVNCFFTRKKIEYFTEILSRLFKFKVFEKIYNFSEDIENSEELLTFRIIITRIMKLMMKPKLKEAFNLFCQNCQNLNNKKKRDYNAKAPFLIIEDTNSSQSSFKNSKVNNNKMKYNPLKMNSFVYESFDSSNKSSYTIEPNSENNDKLHQQLMYIANRDQLLNDENELENDENDYENNRIKTSSNKSAKSLQEICKMKPGLNISRSLSELSKNNNLNNSIKKSISNKSLQKSLSNKSINKNKEKENEDSMNDMDISNKNGKSLKEKIEEIKNNLKPEKFDKNSFEDFKEIPSILTKEEKMKIDTQDNEENKEDENKEEENKEDKSITNNINDNKYKIDNENKIYNDENLNKDNEEKEKNNFNFPDNYISIKDNSINLENVIFENENEEEENEQPKKQKEFPKKEDIKKIEESLIKQKLIENKKEEIPIKKDEFIKEEINNNIELENNIQEEINSNTKQVPTISDQDISAEKDTGNQIDWEYSVSNSKSFPNEKKENKGNKDNINNNQNEKNKNNINEKRNSINGDDDYLCDFEDVSDIEKEDENIISIIKNEAKQNDKSRNNLTNSPQKNNEEEKEEKNNENKNINNNIIIPEKENIKNENINIEIPKNVNFLLDNNEKLTDDIIEEIINNILNSEIKSDKVKLIPKRQYKYDPFSNIPYNLSQSGSLSNSKESPSKDSNSSIKENPILNLSNTSSKDNSLQLLNDSLMSSYSAYSIFNKTIKDQKKENSLKLYYNKIAPKLIILIRKEIKDKYNEIYENISTPLKNEGKGLMISLALQDADMLRNNYKRLYIKKNLSEIINKEKILKEFEPINIKIRNEDNITSDNFYDNMLNNCLIDTTIELINKERLYNECGNPIPWSSRTHDIYYKYEKNNPKKLCDFITKKLLYLLHNRIGLISENYDFLSGEQLNIEREKRILKSIKKELDDNEYQWKNLEMEETQLKVEVTEMIMDQLYNEIIEILEHVQYSRKRPDLYQNKSIYACEEIPKLSFQVTTTENLESGDENDLMNT